MKKFIIMILIAIMMVGFVACDPNPPAVTPPTTDAFYTKGYTKGTVQNADMISDLVYGADNVLKVVSLKNITDLSPEASLAFGGNIDINGNKYNIDFKLNYNKANAQKLIFNVEVRHSEGNAIVFGAYYFRGVHATNLYIQIGNNKIKVPLETSKIETLFPLDPGTLNIETIGLFLDSVLRIKSDSVKYEYKFVGSAISRHYFFKINFQESLKQLESWASGMLVDYKEKIEFMLQNLLGSSLKDIKDGVMPAAEVAVEFNTVGGYQGSFLGGKLANINMQIDIEASENSNTAFSGQPFHAKINLSSFGSSSSLITNIKTEKSLTAFADISENLFEFNAEFISKDKNGEYLFFAEYRYNKLTPETAFVNCKITDKATGETAFAFKYDSSRAELSFRDDGVLKTVNYNLDFGEFATALNDIIANKEGGLFVEVFSFIGSFGFISNAKFSYDFGNNYLKEHLNLSTAEFFKIVDKYSTDDLAAVFAAADLNLLDFFEKEYTIIVDSNTQFLKVKTP